MNHRGDSGNSSSSGGSLGAPPTMPEGPITTVEGMRGLLGIMKEHEVTAEVPLIHAVLDELLKVGTNEKLLKEFIPFAGMQVLTAWMMRPAIAANAMGVEEQKRALKLLSRLPNIDAKALAATSRHGSSGIVKAVQRLASEAVSPLAKTLYAKWRTIMRTSSGYVDYNSAAERAKMLEQQSLERENAFRESQAGNSRSTAATAANRDGNGGSGCGLVGAKRSRKGDHSKDSPRKKQKFGSDSRKKGRRQIRWADDKTLLKERFFWASMPPTFTVQPNALEGSLGSSVAPGGPCTSMVTSTPWRRPRVMRLPESVVDVRKQAMEACATGSLEKKAQPERERSVLGVFYLSGRRGGVPANPHEPADPEPDYDDTMTPVIPLHVGGESAMTGNDTATVFSHYSDSKDAGNQVVAASEAQAALSALLQNPHLRNLLDNGTGLQGVSQPVSMSMQMQPNAQWVQPVPGQVPQQQYLQYGGFQPLQPSTQTPEYGEHALTALTGALAATSGGTNMGWNNAPNPQANAVGGLRAYESGGATHDAFGHLQQNTTPGHNGNRAGRYW